MQRSLVQEMIHKDIEEKKRTNRLMFVISIIGFFLIIGLFFNAYQTYLGREATLENRKEVFINRELGDSILKRQDTIFIKLNNIKD